MAWLRFFGLSIAIGWPGAAVTEETAEVRLLRTIHTGYLQDLTTEELDAIVDGPESQHPRWVLARAARHVLGTDRGWPEYPIVRLLERSLEQLDRWGASNLFEGSAPSGFGSDDLVYTLTQALAVSGQTQDANSVLTTHLSQGDEYQRSVALQALFKLGSKGAKARIREAAEADESIAYLATQTVLIDLFPTWADLARHWNRIPLDRRDRGALFRQIDGKCSPAAVLALHLAGYYPPAPDPETERRELQQLRQAAQTLPGRGCFQGRYFALRSLALRERGAPSFWVRMFQSESISWNRELIARAGFAHFGRAFSDLALDLLETEPQQFVQWELLLGAFNTRRGVTYRDFWDLWQGVPHRQFRLSFPERWAVLDLAEVRGFLDWLEAPAQVEDQRVLLFLLRALAEAARGQETFRLLRLLDARPDREEHYDALWSLEDPAALPYLRFLLAHRELTASTRDRIDYVVTRLQRGEENFATGISPIRCCEPTRECLISQFEDQIYRQGKGTISTEEHLASWLAAGAERAELEITFLNRLESDAEILDPATGRTHRFQHMLGCWREIAP